MQRVTNTPTLIHINTHTHIRPKANKQMSYLSLCCLFLIPACVCVSVSQFSLFLHLLSNIYFHSQSPFSFTFAFNRVAKAL